MCTTISFPNLHVFKQQKKYYEKIYTYYSYNIIMTQQAYIVHYTMIQLLSHGKSADVFCEHMEVCFIIIFKVFKYRPIYCSTLITHKIYSCFIACDVINHVSIIIVYVDSYRCRRGENQN